MRALFRSVVHGLNIQYWKQYERVLGAVVVGMSIGMMMELCSANCGVSHWIGSHNTSAQVLAEAAPAAMRASLPEDIAAP